MAETYPLSIPTNIGVSAVEFVAVDAVVISQSPFTFQQQTIRQAGQQLRASVTLPPMNRADGETWLSFLLRLRGSSGTFLMGDPTAATPRGSAATTPGTPVIDGGSQTGDFLNIRGCPNSATWYLLAGDYIQLGSGLATNLHKVLADTNTDATGAAVLNIWPALRGSPVNGATVIVSSAVGHWRLAASETTHTINEAAIFGITFDAVEAIS